MIKEGGGGRGGSSNIHQVGRLLLTPCHQPGRDGRPETAGRAPGGSPGGSPSPHWGGAARGAQSPLPVRSAHGM